MSDRRERPEASAIVRDALAGTGLDLVGAAGVEAYDSMAPEAFRAALWLSGAQGVVVAGSSGPLLWRRFRESVAAEGKTLDARVLRATNALDGFVRGVLEGADRALAAAGVRFRRFEAAFDASPRVDFLALGRLAGLGAPGPFGMLIHPLHGPWWALRGAWLVDTRVSASEPLRPPCAGCPAPCIGGWANAPAAAVALATPEVRGRCVLGRTSRYDDAQIAYHHSTP